MSSPTVWVVDDDRSIRWVLEKALQGAGLQHAVFDSAKAARKALEVETPTVVMTAGCFRRIKDSVLQACTLKCFF